jgi:hypothetical protein
MKAKESVIVKSKKLKDLKDRFIIVQVGDSERPATADEIKDMRKQFKHALRGIKCRVLVTHHAVRVKVV